MVMDDLRAGWSQCCETGRLKDAAALFREFQPPAQRSGPNSWMSRAKALDQQFLRRLTRYREEPFSRTGPIGSTRWGNGFPALPIVTATLSARGSHFFLPPRNPYSILTHWYITLFAGFCKPVSGKSPHIRHC